MQIDSKVLSERLLCFAGETIKLTVALEKSYTGRHIAGQLMRSASSAGANYEEACGAESRADFIHKIQIVLKELRESLYWLKLIRYSELAEGKSDSLKSLLNEAQELANIIGKSVVTARGNRISK